MVLGWRLLVPAGQGLRPVPEAWSRGARRSAEALTPRALSLLLQAQRLWEKI